MSVFFNNSIYLFGGLSNTVTGDIFDYNLQTHQLSGFRNGLKRPRSGGRAVLIPNTNQIVLMGGYDELYHALNSSEIYQITVDSILERDLAPMHFKRTNFMSAYFDSTVYVFGGENDYTQPVTAIETFRFITGIDDAVNNTPSGFKIDQNYPNPFNPTTTIGYYVSERSSISIKIYDVLGKEVAILVNDNKTP